MRDTNLGWLTLTLAVAICAGCASGDSEGSSEWETTIRRDSAGIAIVENTVAEPADIARWTVDTVPSVTIGVESGDEAYQFGTIRGLFPLPNGMIVVLNGQGETAFEFRFFDSTGKHIVTHGRRGQGPGEYIWVVFAGAVGGDTVVAMDFPNSRLSWVSASGGHLRSLRVEEDRFKKLLGNDAFGVRETMVPLGDSLFAVKAFRPIPNAASSFARANSFDIVDLAADTAIHLARHNEPSGTEVRLSSGSITVMPVDPPEPMHVVDRARKRMCAAITNVAEISCVDAQGKRTLIRWRVDPIAVTAKDREIPASSVITTGGPVRSAADVEVMQAARVWPKFYNPMQSFQLDDEGNFWIRETARDASGKRSGRFRILDPDGRHIAFVNPPPDGRRVRGHIGRTIVLRAFEDADGVPKVGVFRIQKGR